jgi:hypothetical protein
MDQRSAPAVPADRLRPLALAISLAPFIALAIGAGTAFLEPMFSNPPGLLGIPAGIAILGVAVVLGGLGVAAVARRATVQARLLALAGLTVPALLLVLLGPAVILIVINTG